jgi:hypothetical protein
MTNTGQSYQSALRSVIAAVPTTRVQLPDGEFETRCARVLTDEEKLAAAGVPS